MDVFKYLAKILSPKTTIREHKHRQRLRATYNVRHFSDAIKVLSRQIMPKQKHIVLDLSVSDYALFSCHGIMNPFGALMGCACRLSTR